MKEKLMTLPLAELREIAKTQGLKGTTALRKAQLVEKLAELFEEKEAEKNTQAAPAAGKETRKPETKPAAGKETRKPETKPAAEIEKPQPEAPAAAREVISVPASVPSETAPRRENTRNISRDNARENGRDNTRENTRDNTREERRVNPREEGRTAARDNNAGSYRQRPQDSRYQDRRGRQDNSPGRNLTPQRTDSYGRPIDGYGRTTYRKDVSFSQRREDSSQRRDDSSAQRREDAAERRREDSARREDNSRREENVRREEPARREDLSRREEAQDRRYEEPAERRREEADRTSAPENLPARSTDYPADLQNLDSGETAYGILEVMPEGFGFLRSENFLPGESDVYVAPSQIRRFNLRTGDMVEGVRRVKTSAEKFAALLYINTVNGFPLSSVERRPNFENLTPVFPDERIHLELPGRKASLALRVTDLLSPIGKGQRGMIVSPPKAGKTTLLKQVAQAVTVGNPEMYLIILLIDERPEEVTDIKEAITGDMVEVIYSTFDELPDRHKRVSEMVIERAKRLVEHGKDVMILLDSMTRLARAYNLVVPPSGRTLSGGLDPAALYMPKRFFGAARNMREGGSLTILATALIETGSRMDDVVYEEFKGTGNMELVLDRKLSEKRIFPAIDILRSGTRRDDLLLSEDEKFVVDMIHRATATGKPEESVEKILELFARTRNNQEFIEITKKRRIF